jgi:homoserine kinase
MGGFNVATVQNNEVRFIKKEIPPSLKAVIVVPNRPISTHLSRKSLPYKYSKDEVVFNISHSSLLVAAFMSENWEMLRYAALDQFHQSYRMRQMPELFEVQKTALANGALMSTLSGSGSTFFNIVKAQDAKKLETTLSNSFPHFKVVSCNFDNDGVIVEH